MVMLRGEQFIPAPLDRAHRRLVRRAIAPRRGLFGIDSGMQQIPDRAIELRAVRTLEHHCQVIALLPMGLGAQLSLDPLVELRAWQWVGKTDSYVLGASHLAQA